jgi:hypothetical protein
MKFGGKVNSHRAPQTSEAAGGKNTQYQYSCNAREQSIPRFGIC